MSDIAEKPWEHVLDTTSRHRCQPPPKMNGRLGRIFECSCGTRYQLSPSKVTGRAWIPITS